ncbi:MAG: CAP domain-containing protein [Candidatus Dormibacteria bacterium]
MTLLCAACGSATGVSQTPSPLGGAQAAAGAAAASAPDVSAAIAAAEADTYANRYGVADTEYVALVTALPKSAAAHAAYALFLEYRGDGDDAATEAARAVALDPHSGRAQAVLCRVHDWAAELDAAVTAGHTATGLDPSDPLAHMFLAEALADDADYAGSQAEIDAARPLVTAHPTDYLKAELQRQIANLAADSGRTADQLSALQQSLALQPGWLYRDEELAQAQSLQTQLSAAKQTLDTAAKQLPDDVDALKNLGYSAIFSADGQVALSAWQRALTLAPSDAEVLDMIGEVQIAVNRDTNAAVAAFQHALTVNPTDTVAAAYLAGLARFVQGKPEAATAEITAALEPAQTGRSLRPRSRPAPERDWIANANQALGVVNTIRVQAGLAPVQLDQSLTNSAQSHSFYWLFNNVASTVQGLGIHQETSGLPGFSGASPSAREAAFGYSQPWIAEDITHRGGVSAAIYDWLDSVFHRFPILRPDLRVIGYAQTQVGSITMQDMEFGYTPPGSAAPVIYPAAGQTKVPDMFVDNELPDPVPAGKPRTTGYPVTVTFAEGDTASMSSFTLAGPDGVPLTSYLLSPSTQTENSASLLPAAPLRPATTYTAHITGTVDGSSYDRTWSFTTAG